MSRISLVVAILLVVSPALASHDKEVYPKRHFSCANVPWWVHSYSKADIAAVAAELGMTHNQIIRLLRCFRSQDRGIGP